MYVGIRKCCHMYFFLWTVVRKKKKKKRLESHSSNQAVQLPDYPITHSFFGTKAYCLAQGVFKQKHKGNESQSYLWYRLGLNYTTACSILAQPPSLAAKAQARSRLPTRNTTETGTAGSGKLESGHPCLMLWVHIPKRLFHMVLGTGV